MRIGIFFAYMDNRRRGKPYAGPIQPITGTLIAALLPPGVEVEVINDNSPGFGNLGQTWSKPFRTNILVDEGSGTVKKSVLIFGGGYDDIYDNDIVNDSAFNAASEGNAIYVVDAETGDLIWSASNSSTSACSWASGWELCSATKTT